MSLDKAKRESFEEFNRYVSIICKQYDFHDFFKIVDVIRREIYSHYPFIFAPAFIHNPLPPDILKLQKICFAGNCYYLHLVLSDWISDGDGEGKTAEKVVLANHLLRKSIQLLGTIFPENSVFWQFFDNYHSDYNIAVLKEARDHDGVFRSYSEEEFISIARGKTSIAKAATAALSIIWDKEELLDPFSLSQDYFHIAFQLADDVKDWRKDYKAKHYSYVLSKVIESHHLEADVNSNTRPSVDLIGKMLYFSGAAEYALDLSIEYYEKALHKISSYSCKEWMDVIEARRQKSIVDKLTIEATRKAKMSSVHASSRNTAGETVEQKALAQKHIPEAIENAANFIYARQTLQGYWRDFLTNAGESTNWVTGYIGYYLTRFAPKFIALEKAFQKIFYRQNGKGWGYNSSIVIDADSTSWCLLFCNAHGVPSDIARADLELLRTHQKPNGGFATYGSTAIGAHIGVSDPEKLKGWCSSQLCVTSIAIQVLQAYGLTTNGSEIRKAVDFVLSYQNHKGYWESYWWDGRIYGTAHSVRALSMLNKEMYLNHIEKAVSWLLSIQQKDGGWHNGVDGESQPFHTALALQTLIDYNSHELHEPIKKGIHWLLLNQLSDGSWMSHPILRVPEPDCLQPWEKIEWRNGSAGTGIIVKDQNRLFTTSTVLGTLAMYSKSIRDGKQDFS
jgi:sporulenol synthase